MKLELLRRICWRILVGGLAACGDSANDSDVSTDDNTNTDTQALSIAETAAADGRFELWSPLPSKLSPWMRSRVRGPSPYSHQPTMLQRFLKAGRNPSRRREQPLLQDILTHVLQRGSRWRHRA